MNNIGYPNGKKFVIKHTPIIEDVKKSKYGNEIVTLHDGSKIHSKLEVKILGVLNQLVSANRIKSFKSQVKYILQENYKMPDETKKQGYRTVKAITYTTDFDITDIHGKELNVDVKGYQTDIFRIKRKLFEFKFQRELYLIHSVEELLLLLN